MALELQLSIAVICEVRDAATAASPAAPARLAAGRRRQHGSALFPAAAFVTVAMLVADPALAYVGPGAGLTAIGTALALVAAVFLGIVGFVWYPVRRLLRNRRAKAAKEGEAAAEKPGG